MPNSLEERLRVLQNLKEIYQLKINEIDKEIDKLLKILSK